MVADDRLFQVLVEVYGVCHARRFAAPAPDAFFCIKVNAAAFSEDKRAGRTNFGACGFTAAVANRFDEFSREPAVCTDFYAAFLNRVILSVHACADKHAGKTAYAFGHVICF